MRSKEVEESIESLLDFKNALNLTISKDDDYLYIEGLEKAKNDVETVLNYISNLEQENTNWKGKYHLLSRKIDVTPNSVIRDKIKELEKDGIWITEDYYFNEELEDEYPICKTNFSKEEMQDVVKDILKEILGG